MKNAINKNDLKFLNYNLNTIDERADFLENKSRFLNSCDFDSKLKKEYRNYKSDFDLCEPSSSSINIRYVNADTIIDESDLENVSYGPILKEYQQEKLHLLQKLDDLKNKKSSNLKLFEIIKMLGYINADQVITKEFDNKIFNFGSDVEKSKKYLLEDIDLDMIDYSNEAIIKELIKTIDFSNPITPCNLSLVQYDLQHIVKFLYTDNKLNDIDLDVIQKVQYGYNFTEIAETYNVTKQAISKRFNSIVEKICLFASKKERV